MKVSTPSIGFLPEVINNLIARRSNQYIEKRHITRVEHVRAPIDENGKLDDFTIVHVGHPDYPDYSGRIPLWGKFEKEILDEFLTFILETENQIVEEKGRHEQAMNEINFAMYDWQKEMRKATRGGE